MLFAGIDWASTEHAVAVHDDAGKALASFMVEHSAEGFDKLVARLRVFGEPGGLTVAIERPDGRLVDRLLEAGHPVVAVSPNAIKAWREGEVVSGAKSDPGDAAVIAEYLRLRFHLLKPLQPFSDHTLALRAAVRARGDLPSARPPTTSWRPPWMPSGREPRRCSATSPARSRSHSCSATQPPHPQPSSARSRWRRSAKSTATAGVVQPPSSSGACAEPRRALPPSRRRPPARPPCWPTSV
ncbi:MAG TPA: IS110 family transposase [Actinomycetota bacterium]|nr:IS110 family transposase [Actinomycetota bacterium]